MECKPDYPALTQFLQQEFQITPSALETAQHLCQQRRGPMPIILWQLGLLTLHQLEQTWDWLDRRNQCA